MGHADGVARGAERASTLWALEPDVVEHASHDRPGRVTAANVALIGSTLAAAAAPQGEPPKAADVGVTDTEIRLAVIADVDTPVVPGLFQSAVDVMRAWAKLVNKQGGVAGRKVVIDFIDSKLSPNEARDATIEACSEDFAMVGGEALFLNNVDDVVSCPDAQGDPIGIPDLPGLALDPAERCSPVTYWASGDTAFCATKDQHPQIYFPQQGDVRYYLKKNKDLHGVFTLPSDLKASKDACCRSSRRPSTSGSRRTAKASTTCRLKRPRAH